MKIAVMLLTGACAFAAERSVDPTFLYRNVNSVAAVDHYKPLFGAGDRDARQLRGVARFGELEIEPGGSSTPNAYPREEQAWVVLEGSGTLHYAEKSVPIRKSDFFYVPAGIRHSVSNAGQAPLRIVVMGYKLPGGLQPDTPDLVVANIDDVKKERVGGHPPTTLYQLLMGDTKSTRDRIAAGHVLTSLFIMNFAEGGTNFPHHHEREEEIYLVIEGRGDMVAGGGVDGVENRRPAKVGDAYFFRLNTTVGFYNTGGAPARILAVRSLFPSR